MFIAELGVEALCLGFYPGPSCMGKKKPKKNPAAAVHVTTGLCAYLLQFAPSMRKHVAQSSLCEKKPDNTEETDKAVKLVPVKRGTQHLHFVMVLQRERTVHN